MEPVSGKLTSNVSLLKTKVSKYSFWGVFIAVAAIVIATALSSYYQFGQVNLAAIIQTQKSNPVLWVINVLPFVFAFWGQYVSSMISYEAGAMVIDETEKLRSQASTLEYQLDYSMRENTERKRLLAEVDKAKKDAERANKFRGQFLANMSHEIRTPMNGVINMTNLILDTDLTDKQRGYAGIIKISADSLMSIIDDILDFSKIDAGKMVLEEIEFDLRDTLEITIDMLGMRAQEKGLKFTCLVDPSVPSLLKGDSGRLRQVLTNLTSNAIKFTGKGEVCIKVSIISEEEDGCMLRFAIEDTGIGIPADRQNRLFEDFIQADGSTTRKYGGTGLGLSISKQLAQLMGGEIGVNSEEGKGSTFWFTAAFRIEQEDEDSLQAKITESLQGKYVLVQDNNYTNRCMLTVLLDSWKCRHTEASSSLQALEKLRTAALAGDPLDIAILDTQHPEIDINTLGSEIKADSTFASTKFVMMTTDFSQCESSQLQELGFSAYLLKPVRQSSLQKTLLELLGVTEPEIEPVQIVTRPSIANSSRQQTRVLLVEDNLVNQKVAIAILENFGFQPDLANNGAEAITMLEDSHYHLVLMDCQMPVMDGYDATRKIRLLKTDKSETPIIAMTAHAIEDDREKCIKAGMDDYISKPVDPTKLAELIDKWAVVSDDPIEPQNSEMTGEATATDELIFDRDTLLSHLMGNESILKQILATFVQSVPDQLAEIKKAFERDDTAKAELHAHNIKGAAASVSAWPLQNAARKLERKVKHDGLLDVDVLLADVERQLSRLMDALQSEV